MLPMAIKHSDGRRRETSLAYRHGRAIEVCKAAKSLAVLMRHTSERGLYRIPPEVVLRLCCAIDGLGDVVEEGDDE